MITKEQILKVAKEKGVVTREEFFSFRQSGNLISIGQYRFARIKKQKSKELKHLNKLFQELVIEGFLTPMPWYISFCRIGGNKTWIWRKQ